MKKFDKRVKPGTKVLVEGWGWRVVKAVHQTRKWIEVEGLLGLFPRGRVVKFSNKPDAASKSEVFGEMKLIVSF